MVDQMIKHCLAFSLPMHFWFLESLLEFNFFQAGKIIFAGSRTTTGFTQDENVALWEPLGRGKC